MIWQSTHGKVCGAYLRTEGVELYVRPSRTGHGGFTVYVDGVEYSYVPKGIEGAKCEALSILPAVLCAKARVPAAAA